MTTVEAMRRRGGGTGSTIRVLVAIESTRDRALLPALQRAAPVPGGAFLVSRRCMTAQQLEAAVAEFHARERRFGRVPLATPAPPALVAAAP